MRLVTGVVIVARKNVITRDAARQLRDQLTKLRVPTLGVVANEMSATRPDTRNTPHRVASGPDHDLSRRNAAARAQRPPWPAPEARPSNVASAIADAESHRAR